MKTLINQYSQQVKSKACNAIGASFLLLFMAGCGDAASDNGQVVTEFQLTTDPLVLFCPDVGISDESCVLFDPANPFARSAVTNETKFDILSDANPGYSSKYRFYLWATAHARDAQGENQFFTADSLHSVFRETGELVMRDQTIRAYRAVLDDFFGSVTFDVNQNQFLLRDFVGDRIVRPNFSALPELFDSQPLAIEALDEWGYIYDTNTATISRKTD